MTRKTFDVVLLMILASKPAVGLLKMAGRRWSQLPDSSPLETVGDAIQVAL